MDLNFDFFMGVSEWESDYFTEYRLSSFIVILIFNFYSY